MQSLVDVFVSIVLAMLVWPFPVARAMLSPTVQVAGVLALCVCLQLAYYIVAAAIWRQTLGLRLAGLRLSSSAGGAPTRAQVVKWAAISASLALWYAFAPRSACATGLAERLTATRVVSSE
jgi:uncharacterized RDD family membrane protein YckC